MGLAEVPRMSTAFADPTASGFDMCDLANANEYKLAFRERKYAADTLPDVPDDNNFTAGTKAVFIDSGGAAYNVWAEMQAWVEANYDLFLDHDGMTAAGDWDGEATIDVYASLAAFRTVAGLNAGGFRRCASWDGTGAPTFAFGIPQAGDIFGYWIYEDLLNAFSALKYTRRDADFTSGPAWDSEQAVANATGYPTCGTAIIGIDTKTWPSMTANTNFLYTANVAIKQHSPTSYSGNKIRRNSRAEVDVATTQFDCVCDVYYYTTAPVWTGSLPSLADMIFADPDGLGATENTWYFHETLAASDSNPRQSTTYLSGVTTDPTDDITPQCRKRVGIAATDFTFICKWQFTNED